MEPGEARNTAIEAAGANAVLMGILGAAHTPESERAPGRGKAPIDLIRQKRLGQAAKAMSQEVDAAEFLNSEPGAVTQTVPQQTPPEGVYRTTRGFRASEPPSDQPPIIPAPVAPTAPAAGAASKPTLTPALMVDDKPITGGKSHAEIAQAAMARAMATKDPADIDLASKLVDAKENDADHVFVDADGQVLTRDQAKPVLEQITGKPVIEPVQSYHVPEAAMGDTSFKPTVTPETKTTTPETKNAQGRTPEDFGKHIGATFDQSFKWDGKDFHQFTWREKDVPKDNPLYGATFSIPADATPEQALAAAKAKAADFGVPDYKQESPVKKIEEKQPQVKPTPLNKNEVKPENVNQAPVEKPTTDKPTETEVIPRLSTMKLGPGTGAGPGSPHVSEMQNLPAETTVGYGGDIYGVAQRVRDARSKAGQVAPVATGEGVSDVAAVDWGRELLASGADPEKALQDIERTGAVSFDPRPRGGAGQSRPERRGIRRNGFDGIPDATQGSGRLGHPDQSPWHHLAQGGNDDAGQNRLGHRQLLGHSAGVHKCPRRPRHDSEAGERGQGTRRSNTEA